MLKKRDSYLASRSFVWSFLSFENPVYIGTLNSGLTQPIFTLVPTTPGVPSIDYRVAIIMGQTGSRVAGRIASSFSFSGTSSEDAVDGGGNMIVPRFPGQSLLVHSRTG